MMVEKKKSGSQGSFPKSDYFDVSHNSTLKDVPKNKNVLDEFKESEKQFRGTYDNLNIGIAIVALDGRWLQANSKLCEILGYTEKELVRCKFKSVTHPEDAKKSIALIKEIVRKNIPYARLDKRFIRKDRRTIWASLNISVVSDKNGKPLYFVFLIEDITSRKLAEMELHRYKFIFDQSNQQLALADLSGKIVDANNSWTESHGYKRDEIIGKSLAIFHTRKELPVVKRFNQELLRKGRHKGEIIHKRKDGSTYHTLMDNFVLVQGDKRYLVGMATDISEMKNIEAALKYSEGKYKALVNSTDTGYVIIDPKGRVIDANEEYVRLTGHKMLREIKGRPVTEWTAKHDLKRNVEEVQKCFRKGFVRNLEIEYVDKKGRLTPLEINATAVKLNENRVVVTLCRDITERKKAEEELRKTKETIERQVEERTKELEETKDKYQTLFVSSKDAIMTLSPPNWKFTSGNPATLKIFNIKDERVFTSLGPWQLSPEYQPDGQLSKDKAKEMISKALMRGSNFFEWTHKRIDGTEFQATVLLSVIREKDKKDLQATVRDITQQKENEAEIIKQKQFFNSIVENIPNMIFVKDAEKLKFELFNKAGEELLGQKREVFIGKSDYDFFPKKQADFFTSKDREVLRDKKLLDIPEEPLATKRGERILHTRKIPLLDSEGKPTHLLGISEDITDKKSIEKELLRSKEELTRKVEELEKFTKIAVGRELRMVELKKKISRLKNKNPNRSS